ncbi:hypothetical protein EGR_02686 [Echinococcus granulosus]|uniref:Secreted protein n=1 Tax=Echinococcus granulosus TaxID=6210 RepID=W6V7V2_ECHGR|nr:hypothetical protein EGR_02686 [Echinococcus granulosus]EUB62554.1 hypothetical protein EGR_02686 [Echinococcus granulosus]
MSDARASKCTTRAAPSVCGAFLFLGLVPASLASPKQLKNYGQDLRKGSQPSSYRFIDFAANLCLSFQGTVAGINPLRRFKR